VLWASIFFLIVVAGVLITLHELLKDVLYIRGAAMVAGFGMAIGAIQASHYLSCRRLHRTITATADASHISPTPPVDIQSIRTS